MDLIDRSRLLEIIDKGRSKLGDHVLLRWSQVKYIVNKMPSVTLDEEWEVDKEALTELLTKE